MAIFECTTPGSAFQRSSYMAVEYITDMEKIMECGIMSIPAIVVNDKVVAFGKVLKTAEVEKLMK